MMLLLLLPLVLLVLLIGFLTIIITIINIITIILGIKIQKHEQKQFLREPTEYPKDSKKKLRLNFSVYQRMHYFCSSYITIRSLAMTMAEDCS